MITIKRLGLISAEYRYKMLCLALEQEKQIEVSRLVIDIDKPTNAIDTFKIIEAKYADSDNYFIMGSDNFSKIESWKESKELKSNYKYIILNRENAENSTFNSIDDDKMKNISSSLVRKRIKAGESIEGLVPEKVKEYILKNDLYKD